MDINEVTKELEEWKLPSWIEKLNEFEMNAYLAGMLGMEPIKVGPGDVRGNGIWIECKKSLSSRGDYASLCDELERHPIGILSIALVYGEGRGDLLEEAVKKFPKTTFVVKGPSRKKGSGGKVGGIDFRAIGETFKKYALECGIKELSIRNLGSTWIIMELPVIPGVKWGFGIQAKSVRLGLGTSKLEGTPLRQLFKRWEGMLGNRQMCNYPEWYSFEWEEEVNGHRSNKEDWIKFSKVLLDLYLRAKEETKDLLEEVRIRGGK